MEWHEDNRFWETWEPYLFPDDRLKNAASEAEQVVRLLAIPPGSTILDLCCGTGRHSLELARRGFCVTGVDRTGSYLRRARARSLAENLELKFVQCDVRSLSLRGSFDCAINMFTSFDYFEAEKDDLQLLRNAWNALKVGGRVLIETEGKEVMARDFRERQWWWHKDRSIGLQERKVSDEWDRMETTWILIRDGRVAWQSTVSSRIYSAAEFRHLLEKAGFASATIYGNLAGAAYDQHAAGLVALATK